MDSRAAFRALPRRDDLHRFGVVFRSGLPFALITFGDILRFPLPASAFALDPFLSSDHFPDPSFLDFFVEDSIKSSILQAELRRWFRRSDPGI